MTGRRKSPRRPIFPRDASVPRARFRSSCRPVFLSSCPPVLLSSHPADLSRELHDQRPRLRPRQSKKPSASSPSLNTTNKPGARRAEPAEPRVRVPRPRLIAVLHQRLHEHARREEIRHPRADQPANERALIELHVVVVEDERRGERRAAAVREVDVAAACAFRCRTDRRRRGERTRTASSGGTSSRTRASGSRTIPAAARRPARS